MNGLIAPHVPNLAGLGVLYVSSEGEEIMCKDKAIANKKKTMF